jgi:hypothetical protein
MTLLVRMVLPLNILLGAYGCQPGENEVLCERVQNIYNGRATLDDTALAKAGVWGIGGIESLSATPYCSGLLVHSRWVLSAAHCAFESGLWFRIGSTAPASFRVQLGAVRLHPQLDLALLEVVEPEALAEAAVRPIAVRLEPLADEVVIGAEVTLAGVGSMEDGRRGELRFVQERIVAIDPQSITVDGRGLSGACNGDSGGPLLRTSRAGLLQVIGVLSKGAASCRGLDIYLRLDSVSAWITETLGPAQEPADPACNGR